MGKTRNSVDTNVQMNGDVGTGRIVLYYIARDFAPFSRTDVNRLLWQEAANDT